MQYTINLILRVGNLTRTVNNPLKINSICNLLIIMIFMNWKNLNNINLSICKKVLRYIKFCHSKLKKIGKIDCYRKIFKLIFHNLNKIKHLKILNPIVYLFYILFFNLILYWKQQFYKILDDNDHEKLRKRFFSGQNANNLKGIS